MVTGLDTFRRHFAGFEDSFVLIGGAACDLWFTRAGARFRVTRDIDMVLVLEAVQSRFFPHFWAFIRSGGYQTGQRSDGERTYFRFLKPAVSGYPAMIELLSAAPVTVEIAPGQRIVPISVSRDLQAFLAAFPIGSPEWPAISQALDGSGIRISPPDLLATLKAYFQIAE